jgi:hypothetical protein
MVEVGHWFVHGGTLAILKRSEVDPQPEPDLFIFGVPGAISAAITGVGRKTCSTGWLDPEMLGS